LADFHTPSAHSGGPAPRLAESAGRTGTATAASRVLGLTRDQVLAVFFGAGNEMDAFAVAFRIPNLVRDLFAEGSMSAAFVPAFTRHLTREGKAAAFRLGNNVLNTLLIVTVSLVAAGLLFAGPIVTLFAGDFASVPGKLELTVQLTRAMLPFLTAVVAATVAMGMLNSLHHYFVPALSPAMFNIAVIACAFALVPVMPALGLPEISAIAAGVLLGGIGLVLIQWPALRREGFRYSPTVDLHDRALRDVIKLMGPGAIGLAATQINLLVGTLLATGQGTGAVSWLTYAFRLMSLPIGLFGVSIATAALPAIARHAAADNLAGIRSTLAHGLGMTLVLNVPATVGLLMLSRPIVELLFEHGRFTPADTEATAAALRMYAVGLIGYAAARIATPVFYALHQSRTAVTVSVGAVLANAGLGVLLVSWMGFSGLALATAIAALGNGAVSLFLLRSRLHGIDGRALALVCGKVALASIAMASAVWMIHAVMLSWLPGRQILMQAARLGAAIVGGLATLAAAARLLRIDEFDEVLSVFNGRFGGQRGYESC
jgi:putative peptidoglycan lipid II flippase